ncbi:MAG: type II toxin-antitoxin system RelE/ParE family toxin [Candidatus Thermoplasmatota archaeon]|nr:type II toxin-antitoxin system RelE/ParE family toxin [Candidatus Thermoplasmatota archaeon]
MKYGILFMPIAKKRLDDLEPTIRKRVLNKLVTIQENPKRFLKWLGSIKAYSLRVGDYRVIVDLNEEEKIINVLTLGHRKKIYKTF